jgi:hypothetical protein
MNFRLSGHLVPVLAVPALCTLAGCVNTARRGGAARPTSVPAWATSVGLLNPSGTYRAGGLLVHDGTLPFTGSVYYLSTGSPDSTLVVVAPSLANRAFTFAGDARGQLAVYAVSLDFRQGPTLIMHAEARKTIRVESMRESMRADESIVFERFVMRRW